MMLNIISLYIIHNYTITLLYYHINILPTLLHGMYTLLYVPNTCTYIYMLAYMYIHTIHTLPHTHICYMQAVLESQLADDPLDNDEQLQDHMDSLPYLCRFQVKKIEGIGQVSGEKNRGDWEGVRYRKTEGTKECLR